MAVAARGATAPTVRTIPITLEPPPSRAKLGGEQLGVVVGQLAAGAGNLGFALVAARILDPAGFAHLSVFLGLYLVCSLPATSLSAATAIAPERRDSMLKGVARVSVAAAAVIAVLSPFVAGALKLPIPMVLGLAAALPATSPLALDRGRLFGTKRHGRLIASLVAEPAVRLSLGLTLAAGTGQVGAAAAVVIAANLAREVARTPTRRRRRSITATRKDAGLPEKAAGWTAAAFALLAVVQTQDLVLANIVLPRGESGVYAALSTLGGAAAFATVTIPLVLLPRAVQRERSSLVVATGLACALGLGAVGIGALAPKAISVGLFGSRYGSIAHYVVPYLAAMGLLGIARVLAAYRCATGLARSTSLIIGSVVTGQAIAIAIWGRTVGTIAASTVASTAALVVGLGFEQARPSLAAVGARQMTNVRALVARPIVRAVGALTIFGLALRFVVLRGIWLDEATSIHEATMPFGAMINTLRTTDVHPPLYFSLLWLVERVLGSGPLSMRIPSILAGALAIPVAYLAGRDIWDRRSGIVAAAMASVAPILVWYSQEVRMYSLFMLLALLAIWGQARILRYGRLGDWALYVLSSAALVWTEYFAVFQVIAQQAVFVGILISRKGRRRPLLFRLVIATCAIAMLVAPLLPFAVHQFIVNQNAGKGFGAPSQVGLSGAQTMSVYTVLANLAWAVVGYHSEAVMASIVALWPIGILLAMFLLGRNMTERTISVIVAAFVPALLLLCVGLMKRNLFDVRYMSGVVVALLLLTARIVTGASQSSRFQAVACAVIVAVLAVSLGDEQVNGSNPRLYDFAGALHAVDARYRPGDLLVYSPSDLGLVVSYYAPKARSVPLLPKPPTVAPGHDVFVLGSKNLMAAGDPARLGRYLHELQTRDRPISQIYKANVVVWVFRT